MDILSKVEEIAQKIIGNSDAHFIKDQAMNSIQYIELIVQLEDEFDVEFPDELLFFEGKLDLKMLADTIEKLKEQSN